ncbi:Uncharacterized protein LB4E_1763 [Leptospira borgpetersenii str. 4E]|nr:hypothetical protein [Leptospira borgpetersenii]APY24969.1 Uncharacterized protein LB4E_1763 [Leptospira borgpetersenii str. 4E]
MGGVPTFFANYRIESHMDREMWATANSRRTYRFGIKKAKLEYQFL